ncbi:hypothetical protein SAMN02745117_01169 [Lampropedia hyalina DSM 16112]|jgi:uncharacterized membrane protein YqjE|uniref:Uncharacterized protein n=1 Tax=Lampropedia hyalina DSM 16112 TaxID=1122156 RepID=A0A1M4Y4G7_9BURK|nr:hypothetical protein [Lampropedia hyalina]SHF00595.1 hypothetical protein SAMN02745117_01169 [Lampropedia hyalina DSM 16112]
MSATTPPATVPTPYRTRGLALIGLSLLVLVSSFVLLLQAVAPGNTRHLPAILWILFEFLAVALFGLGAWQLKKHRRAQPHYAPDADD